MHAYGACTIILLLPFCNKLQCLLLPFTSDQVQYFKERLEPPKVEPPTGLHSDGKLPALPTNIRLGWKQVEVANTLAYYDTTTIIAAKSFIVHVPGFMILLC